VRDARRGIRLPGGPLVLRLEVDRREDAVVRHPLEEPQPRDPRARADLDDRPGADRGGDHPQGGADADPDRGAAQLLPAASSRLDDLALGHEVLRVGPAGRLL